jgi:hypothetical protein
VDVPSGDLLGDLLACGAGHAGECIIGWCLAVGEALRLASRWHDCLIGYSRRCVIAASREGFLEHFGYHTVSRPRTCLPNLCLARESNAELFGLGISADVR